VTARDAIPIERAGRIVREIELVERAIAMGVQADKVGAISLPLPASASTMNSYWLPSVT
jgi:hypothetical protein